ncbi:MAG: DUF2304 domain-containing protein [Pseudomonadota bacterium]
MSLHQVIVFLFVALSLLLLIIRLIQKGRLDVAYCWLWLAIGVVTTLIVVKYEWLIYLTHLIGVVAPANTLFFLGLIVVLLMCLQFSIVITSQRRQIRRLIQQLAIFESELSTLNSRDGNIQK